MVEKRGKRARQLPGTLTQQAVLLSSSMESSFFTSYSLVTTVTNLSFVTSGRVGDALLGSEMRIFSEKCLAKRFALSGTV